ncbi:nuclear transport factor 2 family protein [Micromonospora noduli]|uniref:nuclear transport factor 2 family protein n=1 Tax=Micromonospora noduli TaxID=709876 RepID=UPI000DD6F95C|nr:nuclear transport factor 2 family protein [Micromonospora noduli]KAB1928220.1 nuclear transport factor 2 family protein [Micromonospora noduli]
MSEPSLRAGEEQDVQVCAAARAPRTSEERETVSAYYRLVDAGDVGGLLQLFSVDAVYLRPGYQPIVGRAEIERFYREQRVIREGCHRIALLVDAAQAVAAHGEFVGVLRDGRHVQLRFADFFTFDDTGHFARRETFFFTPLV